jgi:hypothetical protein
MDMNNSGTSILLRRVVIALALAMLAACATPGQRPAGVAGAPGMTPEETVEQRAVKRWELLIDKQYDQAYDLLSPGYREVRSKEDYVNIMRGRPLQWTRVHFRKADCEAEACSVDLEVHAEFEMPVLRVGTVETLTVVTENWILDSGTWYLVPAADR